MLLEFLCGCASHHLTYNILIIIKVGIIWNPFSDSGVLLDYCFGASFWGACASVF